MESIDCEAIQLSLPLSEVLAGVEDALESVIGEAGLLVIRALLDDEVQQRVGQWHAHDRERTAMRWGRAEGYVSFAGRKVPIQRPRVRGVDGTEVPLERYRLFQAERLEAAVAQRVVRGVSTRQYEGVLDEVCEGYGIRRSAVSRQWKAASAKQRQELMERPLGRCDAPRSREGLPADQGIPEHATAGQRAAPGYCRPGKKRIASQERPPQSPQSFNKDWDNPLQEYGGDARKARV